MKRVALVVLMGVVGICGWRAAGFGAVKPAVNGLLGTVPVPADNAQTAAKVHLGKQLYFDKRLSKDNTVACASCHRPDAGWADPRRVSEGVDHAKGTRNSPTVLNAAYNRFQFWDGRAGSLEEQALGPIQNPAEMQMTMPMAIDRLNGIPGYVEQFQAVFGTQATDESVAKAIAAFERTVVSTDSPYDRFLKGDKAAMSASTKRGMRLFTGKARCVMCHSGPNFTDGSFHNVGVGYAKGKYADEGRYKVTKEPRDMGAFKTPTLRSIALTAPYLHDGSEKNLVAVVEFYDRGGVANPHRDPLLKPLRLTARDKKDLVAFLKSLTGAPLKIEPPELP